MASHAQMPPRNTASNCPCGGQEDYHYYFCWIIHLAVSMASATFWFMVFVWAFSNPKRSTAQDAICTVCTCSTHKLLCPDRGFTRLPDVTQQMMDSIRIMGFQRTSLRFLSGRFLAQFSQLLLLDVREQTHGKCIRVIREELPSNLIIRGKWCCYFMTLCHSQINHSLKFIA